VCGAPAKRRKHRERQTTWSTETRSVEVQNKHNSRSVWLKQARARGCPPALSLTMIGGVLDPEQPTSPLSPEGPCLSCPSIGGCACRNRGFFFHGHHENYEDNNRCSRLFPCVRPTLRLSIESLFFAVPFLSQSGKRTRALSEEEVVGVCVYVLELGMSGL